MKSTFVVLLILTVGILGLFWLSGAQESPTQRARAVTPPAQPTAPEYIKDTVALREGSDGMVIYFTLADKDGRLTSARGRVELEIIDLVYGFESGPREFMLYMDARPVSEQDFRRVSVGLGPFQRDSLVYSFGRIPYREFVASPRSSTGLVRIRFTPAHLTAPMMTGEGRFVF